MNDFTKEELEKLRDGLNYGVANPYGFTADSIMPLYDKIKAMIDNYCEHDHTKSHTMNVRVCDKCKAIF